jgi:cytochrome c-type biogenesis protein CcmH
MILFWLICGLMIVVALAFILPPLLQSSDNVLEKNNQGRRETNIAIYRDQLSELQNDLQNGLVGQQQYEQDRDEIERRVLEDVKAEDSTVKSDKLPGKRSFVYLLGFGLAVVAVVFYLRVGELKGLSPVQATPPMSGGSRSQEQIDANVNQLAERLKSNPNDSEGWVMLARSYSSMQKFGEASGAYAKATELRPNDADLWAEYAFVSAMAAGRQLEGQPMELINRALKIDPDNLKALQLAGNAAFQKKDYKQAVDYWERVLKKVPAGSEVAQSIQLRIDEAKSLGNVKATEK